MKYPEKTDKLLAVYHAIVDNVVTWKCLEENVKLKTKGSRQYKELMRETMISLLTRPGYGNYGGDDVIQCAIKYGAYEMLHEIFNTKGVFRFDELDRTKYDVTNFIRATRADVTETDRTQSIDSPTYLRDLVLNYDKWSEKNILEEQPMQALTTPYFRVVQRCYFILGLLQLIYMICFSHYHMPNTCSLVQLFNLRASGSNCSTGNSSDWNPWVSQDSYFWLWLIWPVILCAGTTTYSYVLDIYWLGIAFVRESVLGLDSNALTATATHGDGQRAERLRTKSLHSQGQVIPALSFCVSVFVWYSRYDDTLLLPYLEATSMVFLFGWITNLVFFSGMMQNLSVFSLVLKEIIFSDIIPRFLPVFLLTLLGFSFALHVLNLYSLPLDDEVYLGATFYEVFAASLGSSDYVKDSRKERSLAGIPSVLFDVVVIGYICMSALILLNVLIAMMNHQYDKAKERANNFWRFQMLRISLDLEQVPVFSRLFMPFTSESETPLLLAVLYCCCTCWCAVCCCYCGPKSLMWDANGYAQPTRMLLEKFQNRKLLILETIFKRRGPTARFVSPGNPRMFDGVQQSRQESRASRRPVINGTGLVQPDQ